MEATQIRSHNELKTSHYEYDKALKLCIFLGLFGVHRYYVKRRKSAILYHFSFGIYFIGWIRDILALKSESFVDYRGLPLKKSHRGPKPHLSPVADTDSITVVILCLFGGFFGVHRLYVGKIVSGSYYVIVLGGAIFSAIFLSLLTGNSLEATMGLLIAPFAILFIPCLILWPIDLITALWEQWHDAEGRRIRNPKQTRYDRRRYGSDR